MNVEHIVTQLGGPAAIGRRLGITSQAIRLWVIKGRIPTERVPQLERFARELNVPLRAEQMRPDVDWAALRCQCEAALA